MEADPSPHLEGRGMLTSVLLTIKASKSKAGAWALAVTFLLLLALTASGQADPLFRASFLPFDTGRQPWSVATADLNGDGRPDLAVASTDYDYDSETILS